MVIGLQLGTVAAKAGGFGSRFCRLWPGFATAAERWTLGVSTKHWDDMTGLGYWGYRWYSSGMGRWLSKDPIGEKGGHNIYQPMLNSLVDMYDALGLWSNPLHLDVPVGHFKCLKVATLISLWALPDIHNNVLWHHYIYGEAQSVELDYSWFDPSGMARLTAAARVGLRARNAASTHGSALPCGGNTDVSGDFSTRAVSPVLMIFQWSQRTDFDFTVTKECDSCDRCLSIDVSGKWTNRASDIINWNEGGGSRYGFWYPPFFITDRLVNACGFGKDYNVSSEDRTSGNWRFDCR